eukprot:COSAG03_NODE_3978_length_1732_cov_79.968769_2_plen_144_part_00
MSDWSAHTSELRPVLRVQHNFRAARQPNRAAAERQTGSHIQQKHTHTHTRTRTRAHTRARTRTQTERAGGDREDLSPISILIPAIWSCWITCPDESTIQRRLPTGSCGGGDDWEHDWGVGLPFPAKHPPPRVPVGADILHYMI